MATRLSEGLSELPGIELAYPAQSNEVFVHLPRSTIEGLNREGFVVNEGELDGSAARFVTAWNTLPEDIEKLLSVIANQ
jgi:threonine aldolase